MKFRTLLLFAMILCVFLSCSNTNKYQSDRKFALNEVDPGRDYSPGSSALDDFDDDDAPDQFPGDRNELTRELTPEVKQRVDTLLAEYFDTDVEVKTSAENKLVSMGSTITDYLTQKINAHNQLEMLNLINKIEFADDSTSGTQTNSNNPESDNNTEENTLDSEEYKPDPSLNSNTLEELRKNGIDVEEIQKFYKLKLLTLQKAYESNDFKKAKELAQAMLALFPQQENTVKYLKYLLGMIEDAIQSNSILQGKVAADKDIYEFGEKIQFKFLLRNVSSKPVKIFFSNDVSRARTEYSRYYSPCIIHCSVSQWSDRTTLSNQESIPYTLEGKTELEPGEVWYHIWEYDTDKAKEGETIGAVKVGADIRPIQVFVGDERVDLKAIKLVPKEVKVYPSGYKELSNGENVIGNLKEALKNEESVRIIIAATAAGKDENQKWEATEILIDALKSARGDVRISIFKGLRAIHGFDLAYDENFWREWYNHNKPK